MPLWPSGWILGGLVFNVNEHSCRLLFEYLLGLEIGSYVSEILAYELDAFTCGLGSCDSNLIQDARKKTCRSEEV